MKVSRWYLINEKTKPLLRRCRTVDGKPKWERYPAEKYKDLPLREVQLLFNRLNATHEIERRNAEARYDFDHAYINTVAIEKFELELRSDANSEKHIVTMMSSLNKYVFGYFVLLKKTPDPKFWIDIESEWGLWLEKHLGYSSIKQTIQLANRFLRFLSRKIYKDLHLIELEPLGKRKLASIKVKTTNMRFKYISRTKFQEIIARAELDAPTMVSPLKLGYLFGLRCNETLGLTTDNLLKKYLNIDKQGFRFANGKLTLRPTKTLKTRQVPYWYASPAEVMGLIEDMVPCHPDTLNKRLNAFLSKFGHESHDLRRSFVTTAVRLDKYSLEQVRDAAGHSSVAVTELYLLQTEGFDDEQWTPGDSWDNQNRLAP